MKLTDLIAGLANGYNVPRGSTSVTPDDGRNLDGSVVPAVPVDVARELIVLAAGTVAFVGADGASDSWVIPATLLPFRIRCGVRQVKNTGTSIPVGSLKALW